MDHNTVCHTYQTTLLINVTSKLYAAFIIKYMIFRHLYGVCWVSHAIFLSIYMHLDFKVEVYIYIPRSEHVINKSEMFGIRNKISSSITELRQRKPKPLTRTQKMRSAGTMASSLLTPHSCVPKCLSEVALF